MFGFLDIFGGSKRRSALQLLDRTLSALEVNPAYIDDGMRFAIFRWAQEAAAGTASESGVMDALMRRAAELISFCVIGPAETEAQWGPDARAEREARFNAVVDGGEDETFDAKLIKLVLAKDIAAPDVRAMVSLERD
ncbi:MAG: hypothetical protein AB7E79_00090 [Rhodospirillaceae bacterium]